MTIWFSASCSFTILPNSVGLPAFPLRMTSVDGSNRLTILPSAWGVAGEDARFGLAHHLLHARRHLFELVAETLQHWLSQDIGGRLDAVADLFGEALRLAPHPAGRLPQFAAGLFYPCVGGWALAARPPRQLHHPHFHAP